MKKSCAQCQRDFNGTAKNDICIGCRRLNDGELPIGYATIPQNLERYRKQYDQTPYGGTLADNLVQTAAAALMMEAATAGLTPDGDGALSDCFSGGGGDFSGGGASGSW